VFGGVGVTWPRFASKWWKDIVNMKEDVGLNWFNSEVLRRVGNDLDTSFFECGVAKGNVAACEIS